jgi:hypothetical protein
MLDQMTVNETADEIEDEAVEEAQLIETIGQVFLVRSYEAVHGVPGTVEEMTALAQVACQPVVTELHRMLGDDEGARISGLAAEWLLQKLQAMREASAA